MQALSDPSMSPYSYPVVMVLKKEGSWKMCPDLCCPQQTYHQRQIPHSCH
jgi:hypothetical protein